MATEKNVPKIPWSDVDKIGFALVEFTRTDKFHLNLAPGKVVIVRAEKQGWYKGVVFPDEDVGIFPAQNVAFFDDEQKLNMQLCLKKLQSISKLEPIEVTKEEIENEESLLYNKISDDDCHEILKILATWAPTLKYFFEIRSYSEFDKLASIMSRLAGLFKQVEQKEVPPAVAVQEIDKAVDEVAAEVVMHDFQVKVTNGKFKGEKADETNTPVVEWFKMLRNVEQRDSANKEKQRKLEEKQRSEKLQNVQRSLFRFPLGRGMRDASIDVDSAVMPASPTIPFPTFPDDNTHLLTEIQSCIFTLGEPTEVYLSLYDSTLKDFITEEFMVEYTAMGVPRDAKLFGKIYTIFKDISSKDYKNNLYVVCRIYRIGGIIIDESKSSVVGSVNLTAPPTPTTGASSSQSSEGSGILRRSRSRVASSAAAMASVHAESTYPENVYRRPFGCAVLLLDSNALTKLANDEIYKPDHPVDIYETSKEELFPQLHELIIKIQTNSTEKVHHVEKMPITRATGLSVAFRMFFGSYDDVLDQQASLAPSAVLSKVMKRKSMIEMQASSSTNLLAVELNTVPVTQKLGFPETISPGDMRNDLYLTIEGGSFKFNDVRNIEVLVHVILPSNDRSTAKQQCITRHSGLGDVLKNEYRSGVYYHAVKPQWLETIRISLEPKLLEQAVLLFMFTHCSNKKGRSEPFGFSFFQLAARGKFKEDASHALDLYKWSKDVDVYKIHDFIGLAEKRSKLVTRTSSFSIRTKLISTKVTTHVSLKNLLKWSEHDPQHMAQILNDFLYAPMLEIIKFLREIFDALFSILTKYDNEQVASIVYKALVNILKDIVTQTNLAKFANTVNEYIQHHFHCTRAHHWLLHFLIQNLELQDKVASLAPLNDSMRCIKYLIQFIIRSHRQEREAQQQHPQQQQQQSTKPVVQPLQGEQQQTTSGGAKKNAIAMSTSSDFHEKINYVMKRIVDMMRKTEPKAIVGAQGVLLKFMNDFFDHVSKVYEDDKKLGQLVVSFLEAIQESNKAKLGPIGFIVRGKVFKRLEAREKLLPKLKKDLHYHAGRSNEERVMVIHTLWDVVDALQKGLSKRRDNIDSVTLAIKVMLSIVPQFIPAMKKNMGNNKEKGSSEELDEDGADETLDDATPQSSVSASTPASSSQQISSVLSAGAVSSLFNQEELETRRKAEEKKQRDLAVNTMFTIACVFHYTDYGLFRSFINESDRQKCEIITEYLTLVEIVMYYQRFLPENWISFHVFVLHTTLNFLRTIGQYLCDNFLRDSDFDFSLWSQLFSLNIDFILLSQLQLEQFPKFKQNLHCARFGDLRVEAVALLSDRWHSLNEKQQHFVPQIIDKVMKLARIHKQEVLLSCLDIYYSILQREFGTNRSLKNCEGITQRCIINMDPFFIDTFIKVLEQKLNADTVMKEEGLKFLKNINHLVELIRAVHKYQDTQEDDKADACFKIMDYFETDNPHLYYKYIHTLYKVHESLDNFVEAGNTLRQHADKLNWDDKILRKISDEFPSEMERVRKEKLYQKAIEFYDKGRDWERGIQVIKTLVNYFENETFDYYKIGPLLEKQGVFYKNIVDNKRFYASYFLVAFYGAKFEKQRLNGMKYIYRGKEVENHKDFQMRIRRQFPDAEILTAAPSTDITNNDGQWIYIETVKPSSVEEINNEFKARDQRLPTRVHSYNQNNNVDIFCIHRTYLRAKEANEHRNKVRVISFFITQKAFPTIKRRMLVTEQREITLSPIENAIRDLDDRNRDMNELIINHKREKVPDLNALAMILQGTIDAKVNGGINMYLDAFFKEDYISTHTEPSDIELIQRLKRVITVHMDTLQEALLQRKLKCTAGGRLLIEHHEREFKKMKEMVENCFNSFSL